MKIFGMILDLFILWTYKSAMLFSRLSGKTRAILSVIHFIVMLFSYFIFIHSASILPAFWFIGFLVWTFCVYIELTGYTSRYNSSIFEKMQAEQKGRAKGKFFGRIYSLSLVRHDDSKQIKLLKFLFSAAVVGTLLKLLIFNLLIGGILDDNFTEKLGSMVVKVFAFLFVVSLFFGRSGSVANPGYVGRSEDEVIYDAEERCPNCGRSNSYGGNTCSGCATDLLVRRE